jgi:quercetin dioxygenase-like cupin family protein
MDQATVIPLVDHVQYAPDAVVSKTLVDQKTGTLTLFAFDAGQGLSEHTAPFDAVVQVLDGEAELTVGGDVLTAGSGTLVVMPAHVPHSLRAVQRFKMLLTMIRS